VRDNNREPRFPAGNCQISKSSYRDAPAPVTNGDSRDNSEKCSFCDNSRRRSPISFGGMVTQAPPGLSEGKAARMMAALREGRTLRTFGVRAPRLVAYFKAHPEYAREARPLIAANKVAALRRKGARLRDLTHCKHGHSLADAFVSRQAGYIKRDCRTCWAGPGGSALASTCLVSAIA
jgi:hypothetical protein